MDKNEIRAENISLICLLRTLKKNLWMIAAAAAIFGTPRLAIRGLCSQARVQSQHDLCRHLAHERVQHPKYYGGKGTGIHTHRRCWITGS